MGDFNMNGGGMDGWVIPNDRHLALRAKLGTGWSVHTKKLSTFSKPVTLSEKEQEKILRVIQRAEQMDLAEQGRIGHLVEKLENMKNNAIGNGQSQCILCGAKFGFGTTPTFCSDCANAVCVKCCVDTLNSKKQTLWLCKICSENRELWKKSGAWFFKGIPKHTMPVNSFAADKLSQASSKSPRGTPQLARSTRSTRSHVYNSTWSRVATPSEPSSDEQDSSSSSDDEVNFVKRKIKRHHDSDSTATDISDSVSERSGYSDARLGVRSKRSSLADGDNLSVGSGTWRSPLAAGAGLLAGSRSLSGSKTSINSGPQSHLDNVESEDDDIITNKANKHVSLENTPKVQSSLDEGDIDSAFSRYGGRQATHRPGPLHHPPPTIQLSTPDSPEYSSLGTLEFSLLYDSYNSALHVTILRARGLPAMDSNGFADPYVKLHLLPGATKSTKLRTRIVHKSLNPEWNENMTYYGITEKDMEEKTLRLTVLDDDNLRSSEIVGEHRLILKSVKADQTKEFSIFLDKASPLEKDDLVYEERGKVYIGLCYNSNKETFQVKVIRCSQLAAMDPNGYSDPYVKVYLKPDKDKKSKHKTAVKKRTLNPEYNEEFKYKIPRNELAKKTLEITVWDKDIGRSSDYIGGIHLGISSKGQRLKHWFRTLQQTDEWHEYWHNLSPEAPAEKY